MKQTGVRIAGVGHYVPERVLTNADFEKMLDTSDEWIQTRTGMRERHIAAPDQPTSDLCAAAARDALARGGIDASSIDCVIVATVTPDYAFPATACIVASKLGITGCAAFDIEIACSGFIYGLAVGSSLVRSGIFRRVLLIGGEELSRLVNYQDRNTAILFGDGAGAVILETSETDAFLGSDMGSDGSNPASLLVPVSGTAAPTITADDIAAHRNMIYMDGKEVFRFAVTKMLAATKKALEVANISIGDVAWVIPHQANRRIIEAAAKQLAIPSERVIINIHNYGNTSAASIAIALSETEKAGKLKDGDILLFVGFGGGLSWGAVAWRWSA